MNLFSFLVIFQALSIALSYDIELQGYVKLGSDFYNSLGIQNEKDRNSVFVRNRHNKKFARSSIMRAASVRMNKTNEILKYVDHIKKKGIKIFKHAAKLIMIELPLGNDFMVHINNVTEDYLKLIDNYTEFVAAEKAEHVIDEEFIFLDLVETACRYLYNDQTKLLDEAVEILNSKNNSAALKIRSNKTSLIILETLSQTIYKHSIQTKKEEMRYICNNFDICRPYPAFTDYFADFIVEVLKLPENKLRMFIKLLKQLTKSNVKFFSTIIENEDMEKIVTLMKGKLNSLYHTHETLTQLRLVLTDKFKIIHSPDLKHKIKTQAMRILLDIINKAFDYDDAAFKEFSKTVTVIRSWQREDKDFPESIIKLTYNNMIKVLDDNLTKQAKTELSVLIETILRGSSNNENMQKNLFNEGSKYVKDGGYSSLKII